MYSHQWECSELSGCRLHFISSFSVLKRSQRFIATRGDGVRGFASLDDWPGAACSDRFQADSDYQPKTLAKINGVTIVASDSMMNFGVSMLSLPQVIFSLG